MSICKAKIANIENSSIAYSAGLKKGDIVTHINNMPLRDMIDWQWNSDGLEIVLTLLDGKVVHLERQLGEPWGIEFDANIFDQVKTCCNSCVFCFMDMLPFNMRSSLYLKDDDYRLSFLQGNFVTLSNIGNDDLERIVEQQLCPLYVSLQAITPSIRKFLIGKNAQRGLKNFEFLAKHGIEMNIQLVLCPGVNDGQELNKTLNYLEQFSSINTIGLIPVGYTKYSKHIKNSFSDDKQATQDIINEIERFLKNSKFSRSCIQLADEFYIAAGIDFPPAQDYGEFPLFYDGIGMMRSFIDEWNEIVEDPSFVNPHKVHVVCGESFGIVLSQLIEKTHLHDFIIPIVVDNAFFGGNVDVSGLLTAQDIIPCLKHLTNEDTVLLPLAAFNDDMLTLDDYSLGDIDKELKCQLNVCSYKAHDILL